MYLSHRKHLSRRHFIKGSGVAVSLPMLSAMTPAFSAAKKAPLRFVAMNAGLGFHSLISFLNRKAWIMKLRSTYGN